MRCQVKNRLALCHIFCTSRGGQCTAVEEDIEKVKGEYKSMDLESYKEAYKSMAFFKLRACNCFFSELLPMSILREGLI